MNHRDVDTVPPPAGAYSHLVMCHGLVFTCGMGPVDPQTGKMPERIDEQTRQVLINLEQLLRAQELSLSDVAKASVHLADVTRDFAEFDRVYREVMPAPFPVRTTVGSSLPAGLLVEIDFIAAFK